MANISTYLEEKLLSHVFRNVEYTRPGATIYIAIFANDKSEAELEANNRTGEITGYTGTDRPGTEFNEADPFQQAGKATVVNAAALEYLVMPAVTVGYVAAMDSAAHAGGNILYWAQLTADKACNAGDTFRLPAGDVKFDLD
jgi:hypothetical protein